MNKFSYHPSQPWSWRQADQTDVEAIMDLMEQHYQHEADAFFTINRTRMGYHLRQAILDQQYQLNTHVLGVAVQEQRMLAWHWCSRGAYQPYSNDEMATGEFVHIDLNLPPRVRIMLCTQILEQWCAWSEVNQIPVLASTTIRTEQAAFMRIHERLGFTVKGSFAWKRIK